MIGVATTEWFVIYTVLGCYAWFHTVLIWLFISRTRLQSLYCCEQMEGTIFQGCNESFSDKLRMESKDNMNVCSHIFQVLLSTHTATVAGLNRSLKVNSTPVAKHLKDEWTCIINGKLLMPQTLASERDNVYKRAFVPWK